MRRRLLPRETIQGLIHRVRGQRVIFDFDMARLYAVETRVLVQSVKRNPLRFPTDFMFELTREELEDWRSHIVISNPTMKMGLRRCPHAFTEYGAGMLANVLRSQTAIDMSVHVVRAFIHTRELLVTHAQLAAELRELERRFEVKFKAHDQQLVAVFRAIEQLISAKPDSRTRRIGF